MQETHVDTPVGRVAQSKLAKIKALAGFKFDNNGHWVLLKDKIKGVRINPNNHRKANEDHFVTSELWLPVRYYNFCYALGECSFNINKAIEFVEKNLFVDGKPVNLPEYLLTKGDIDDNRTSYTKIMKLVDEKKKYLTPKQ